MPIQITPRDENILRTIQEIGDGMLPTKYVWPMFWPASKSPRAAQRRLKMLREDAYLVSFPKSGKQPGVTLLGWKGIQWISEKRGVKVETPKNRTKHQLDQYQKRLRKHGIRWLRKPPDHRLHDIKAIDVRLAFDRSAEETPDYSIEQRLLESHFRRSPDVVELSGRRKDGKSFRKKRGVIPDDFVLIVDERRRARGEPCKIRALLEIDTGSHSNPAFGNKKVSAYSAYIGSPQYEARFGSRSGRWLVVTTGKRRMNNLIRETERVARHRARLFYFSHFDLVSKENVFMAPIWWQPGVGERLSMAQLE